jgi:chemotaxis response regulator CheB
VRCLVVDDSAVFVDAMSALLEHHGLSVVGVASNGVEALRRFEELSPDVTLIDVDLGAESGFDVAEQLHRIDAATTLILISTHAAQDFAELVALSPAVGFLSKASLSPAAIRDLVIRSAGLEEGDRR